MNTLTLKPPIASSHTLPTNAHPLAHAITMTEPRRFFGDASFQQSHSRASAALAVEPAGTKRAGGGRRGRPDLGIDLPERGDAPLPLVFPGTTAAHVRPRPRAFAIHVRSCEVGARRHTEGVRELERVSASGE
eukprot:2393684-Rhodomonas_salina.2